MPDPGGSGISPIDTTVVERFESRRWTSATSGEYLYVVYGSDDADEIRADVLTTAPATAFGGLPQTGFATEQVANGIWYATVAYGRPSGGSVPQTGESVFSFETGGGTQHITQSKQTIATYGRPGVVDLPDYKGAIGVNDEGVPEGVDIVVPVYNFSETHYIDDASIDALKTAAFNLTGRVNDNTWRGFNAGEVLLMGVSGSRRGDQGDWEVTFRFAASPNVTGLSVGDITGIDKKGWEYLWLRYREEETTVGASTFRVTVPVYAFVERVYDEGDFTTLGIGS